MDDDDPVKDIYKLVQRAFLEFDMDVMLHKAQKAASFGM